MTNFIFSSPFMELFSLGFRSKNEHVPVVSVKFGAAPLVGGCLQSIRLDVPVILTRSTSFWAQNSQNNAHLSACNQNCIKSGDQMVA